MYRDRKYKLGLVRKPDRYVCLAAYLAISCPLGRLSYICLAAYEALTCPIGRFHIEAEAGGQKSKILR